MILRIKNSIVQNEKEGIYFFLLEENNHHFSIGEMFSNSRPPFNEFTKVSYVS